MCIFTTSKIEKTNLISDHGGVEREHVSAGEPECQSGLVFVLLLLCFFPEKGC
jgi:hypothetical protein